MLRGAGTTYTPLRKVERVLHSVLKFKRYCLIHIIYIFCTDNIFEAFLIPKLQILLSSYRAAYNQ